MTGKELRAKILAGDTVYGTLVVADSPKWLGAMSNAGLDYVFIDLEHIAIERKNLSWMCQAYRQLGIPPIVRIVDHDPNKATMALDAGACGILSPYIEEPSQVEALIGAVKMRPLKGKKVRDLLRGDEVASDALAPYLQNFNKDHVLMINIESRRAVENLEALLSFEGVDGIIIGPHDLSCSYDMPEDYENPQFIDLVSSILAKARAMGKGAGIHQTWGTPERAVAWAKEGANIILYKADIILFMEKLAEDLSSIRKSLHSGLKQVPMETINI